MEKLFINKQLQKQNAYKIVLKSAIIFIASK